MCSAPYLRLQMYALRPNYFFCCLSVLKACPLPLSVHIMRLDLPLSGYFLRLDLNYPVISCPSPPTPTHTPSLFGRVQKVTDLEYLYLPFSQPVHQLPLCTKCHGLFAILLLAIQYDQLGRKSGSLHYNGPAY